MRYVVSGLESGPTVLFIHGWPDGPALWEQAVSVLGDKFRCVLLIIPGYGFETKFPKWGFTIPQIAADMYDTIQNKIMVLRPASDTKPMLVAHDWGCCISYELLYNHPDCVSRLVALDVGQHIKMSLKSRLMVVWYQWTLIFLFLLPSFLGDPLTRAFAGVLGCPKKTLPSIRARMNYMYFQVWKLILTNKVPPSLGKWNPPKVPALFMYGKDFPCTFHSKRWIDHVASQKDSLVVPVKGQHWFLTDPSTSGQTNDEIRRFLIAGVEK